MMFKHLQKIAQSRPTTGQSFIFAFISLTSLALWNEKKYSDKMCSMYDKMTEQYAKEIQTYKKELDHN